MVDIHVESLGKKYFREWIFRKLDFQFSGGKAYAITGPNGSGKSTLLKTISGSIPSTEGSIIYRQGSQTINPDYWPRYISYSAPYLEVIEEFSLQELLDFHFSFKPPVKKITTLELAEKMWLENSLSKQIKNFSSGMKQRLKLGLSFFTQSPILLLDEPTTNLDAEGIDWYLQNIEAIKNERLIIVCSNQTHEYGFCEHILNITNYKLKTA